jgi:hypothetical protein
MASAATGGTPLNPADPPSAPTILTITPGDEQLSVAFTAGSDGGASITNYEYSTDDGGTWTARSPSSDVSPIVIIDLENGRSYQVRLRAVNSAGPGAASEAVQGTPSAIAWVRVASEIHQTQANGANLTDPALAEVNAGRITRKNNQPMNVAITTTYTVEGVGLGTFRAALIDRASSGDLLNGNFGCSSCGAVSAGGRHFDNVDVAVVAVGTATSGTKVLVKDGATESNEDDRVNSITVTISGTTATVVVEWVLDSSGSYSSTDGAHLVILYSPSS